MGWLWYCLPLQVLFRAFAFSAMGSGPSANVKPSTFFASQGFPGLPDDATKKDIFVKVCSQGDQFELSEKGHIQEKGMRAKDLQVGNEILQVLEQGVGAVAAAGGDPIDQMLRNFDTATQKFKKEGKILTYVTGEERTRNLEVEAYSLDSVKQVADILISSLTTGFGLPLGLSRALVFPKIAEFLTGLAKSYEKKQASYDLSDFTVQFVNVDKEMKCTSVTAYRFKFTNSDKQTKYWICSTKSDSKMCVYCRKATFLCTKELKVEDMFD